jgi:hypothetical protein
MYIHNPNWYYVLIVVFLHLFLMSAAVVVFVVVVAVYENIFIVYNVADCKWIARNYR